MTVLLFGVTNNGSPVVFSNNQADTGPDGVATFTGLTVNKTGAYKLVAGTVKIDDQVTTFTSDKINSNKFNVRP